MLFYARLSKFRGTDTVSSQPLSDSAEPDNRILTGCVNGYDFTTHLWESERTNADVPHVHLGKRLRFSLISLNGLRTAVPSFWIKVQIQIELRQVEVYSLNSSTRLYRRIYLNRRIGGGLKQLGNLHLQEAAAALAAPGTTIVRCHCADADRRIELPATLTLPLAEVPRFATHHGRRCFWRCHVSDKGSRYVGLQVEERHTRRRYAPLMPASRSTAGGARL
jgi:hypothetical protein